MPKILAALTTLLLLTASAAPEPPHFYYMPVIVKTTTPIVRGVAVGSTVSDGCADAAALGATWWYDWNPGQNGDCPGYVPMVYGPANVAAAWQHDKLLTQGRKAGWLLGYNEPDLTGVTPDAGAVAWRDLETLADGIKLVSPAASQHNPGWLLAMVNAYRARYGKLPRFDAIAWHYYGTKPDKTKAYLLARHNEFAGLYPDAPIWLTEFNLCWGGSDNIEAMLGLLYWLDTQPWVGRYAWFINRPVPGIPDSATGCTLLTEAGQLTPAGELYRK